MSNWVKFTAGENLEAGDQVTPNAEGLVVKAEADDPASFAMLQKVKAGKKFAYPADKLPQANMQEAGEELPNMIGPVATTLIPQSVVDEFSNKKTEPILSGADPKLVKTGYEYQGSDGKGNYYYANASGAYTLKTNGQLMRVGNRFDATFLKTLKA